jgi:DNA-binding Lrp family transcriptional regulator
VFPSFSHQRPHSGRISLMDSVNRKILALLQEDGRLTVTELAA